MGNSTGTVKFILHVWTKGPETPWALHFDGGAVEVFSSVKINCPVVGRSSGHEPCARWYLEGNASQIFKGNGECEIW